MGEPKNKTWDAVREALRASRKSAPIQRVFHTEAVPLSYAQEGIWLHEQLFPDAGAYNTTLAVELSGPLDAGGLDIALTKLVRRHEILRTCIRAKDGRPYQEISTSVAVRVGFVDLTHEAAGARPAEIRRLALAENMRSFDLGRAPLWRFILLRIHDATHVLLMTVHHIVWDQTSYSIFLEELTAAYADIPKNPGSTGSDLGIQYSDFAQWERKQSGEDRLRSQIEYWKKKLSGCSWDIELPLDKPRPLIPTFTGRSRWFQLDRDLTVGLKALCRSAETTIFVTMLAAFAALLARYGNDTEFIVGTPFSKRQRTELRPMIGPLINLLMLRLNVHDDPTIMHLLQHVQSVVLEAYANQEAPFEQVVAAVQPDRDRGGRRHLQAIFTFYRMPREACTAGGLEVKPFDVEDGKARMDLELYTWEADDGLRGRFIFNADLFDNSTMERISQHYLNLLSGMVADPGCRLSGLPLLTPGEQHQLLTAWNRQTSDEPAESLIHELFEDQVSRTPTAAAVVCEGRSLTYGELNTRADRLARQLRHRGAGVGTLIAIYLERDPDLIIALLAILKAGGAYLPLDLADPPERTRLMLADSNAELLLTTSAQPELLRHSQIETMLLDEPGSASAERAAGAEPSLLREGPRWAYVMYTSGSTGGPKGIAVSHRAVVDLVRNTEYVTLGPGDRIAQAANVSFDAATFEIWGALLNGGMLVILRRETLLFPAALAAALKAQRIDTLFLTTALFNRMASEAPNAFHGLRDLLFGGEAVDPHWVRRVHAHDAPKRLVHVYGPTENTTFSTWYLVDGVAEDARSVPIGRPIGRTRAYVLDPRLQPVPVGVAGELYLAGPGLAWGYPDRPALTTERFVPDPFATEEEGGRLYRTGDLVRYHGDGNLEFLDRIDNQVKIRGHRIELGEIEAALALHPNVTECVVLEQTVPAREGVPEDKRLVAFVVPSQDQLPEVTVLRGFLMDTLPHYMLPSAFVPVQAIPRTPSGKLDRRTLSERGEFRQVPADTFVAPHTEIEKKLAEIWKRVLWLEQDPGIHDNFFDLGGHSLLAAVLVAEIEKELETTVPAGALFRLSTISELAGHLEPTLGALTCSLAQGLTAPDSKGAARLHRLPDDVYRRLLAYTSGWTGERASPGGGLMVGLNLGGRKSPLFWCLQGFEELQQLAKYLGDGQPTFGMRSGHLAMQYSAENIRALAIHYVNEILSVEPEGPYLVGGNCQGAYIAWAIAEELRDRGKCVPLLCLQLLDYRQALPYSGHVALFFGSEVTDPYTTPDVPEPAWHELFPNGFSIDAISGTHRWHFVEPHIQDFAEKLSRRIAQALTKTTEKAIVSTAKNTNAGASLGILLLGMHGAGASVVADLLLYLWAPMSESAASPARREIIEIHDTFFQSLGYSWDDTASLGDDLFRGEAAIKARARLAEVLSELMTYDRWVVDDPRLCRLLPLWDGLLPGFANVHFLHVLRSPPAIADFLGQHDGFSFDKSLFLWLLHYLDAEVTTRGRQRSWLQIEDLATATPAGVDALRAVAGPLSEPRQNLEGAIVDVVGDALTRIVRDNDKKPDALRFQPWIATAYRALVELARGQEISGRTKLDAVRFGLDGEKRPRELDRLQEENDRLRETNDYLWRESVVRVQEENDRLRHELDASLHAREETREALLHAQSEHERIRRGMGQQLHAFQQSSSWKLTSPLRWLATQMRNDG